MIKVIYVPVNTHDRELMNYLEKNLNDGYSVIRADSCNNAIMYIIEKKDNKLSNEEIKYRAEQKALQTEMLKEIIKRDRLLKNYKEKISYLKVRDCLIGAHVLGAQFDDLNKETEELLSSEVWEG